jgi:hypothetical protein
MKQKTYLSHVTQLEKTLGLLLSRYDMKYVEHIYMGRVAKPHRLLLVGDIVAFMFDNGGGERWQISTVSSKGYKLFKYRMEFFHHHPSWRRLHKRGIHKGEHRFEDHLPEVKENDNVSIHIIEQLGQPTDPQYVRFNTVVDQWSSDPAVQLEIAESLRAGAAVRP